MSYFNRDLRDEHAMIQYLDIAQNMYYTGHLSQRDNNLVATLFLGVVFALERYTFYK